jgi:DNA-directed RNA polymerase subunit RPC12/RpoP
MADEPRIIEVSHTRAPEEVMHVQSDVRQPALPGGPVAIVANAYDGTNATQAEDVPAQMQYRLYLCRTCGENGILGRAWLEQATYTGPVWCPACKAPIDEVEWPHATAEDHG